jgi:cytidylate kinase
MKLLCSIDSDRAKFLRALTGLDWLDATQYHLSIDTSVFGLDKAEDIILDTLHARFADVKIEARN